MENPTPNVKKSENSCVPKCKRCTCTAESLVDSRSSTMTDPAGLLFSGKVKIFDPNTNEVFVEQRSE